MNSEPSDRRRAALEGVLIGTAVGDALGLPMEGLSARRQARLFPRPLRHRLVGRCGMISDDTEHTFMVGQSLLEAPADAGEFQRRLARRLRWWLAALPAGVGFATLRSILRLWIGISPKRSGVWSAGNGPAMRSAVLGVFFADDPVRRKAFVQASTEITHRDPRAQIAALAVAEIAAWMIAENRESDPIGRLRAIDEHPEWNALLERLAAALARQSSVLEFAQANGAKQGVSGYAFQSVPVAIYAALRHIDDFSAAVDAIIACGGDTDTTAAITGALLGVRVGVAGIPEPWCTGIIDYPRSLSLLRTLAAQLARPTPAEPPLGPVRYAWPAIPFRNVFFLAVILLHGLRRLFPPYSAPPVPTTSALRKES